MAALAKMEDIFEEVVEAPKLLDFLSQIPANATDNEVAAVIGGEREKIAQWEVLSRRHVESLIEWPNPSPGMREIQSLTVPYLRAIAAKLLAQMSVDIQQLSAALSAPEPVAPRFAIQEVGTAILDLRLHQYTVLGELASRLDAHLGLGGSEIVRALEAPAVEASAVESIMAEAAVQLNEMERAEAALPPPIAWLGAVGIAVAAMGVAMPILGGPMEWSLAAIVGFALWWRAGEVAEEAGFGEP